MKRFALALAAMTVLVPGSVQADQAADFTGKVEAGKPYTWDGTVATGANWNYWSQVPALAPVFPVGTCTRTPQTFCDQVLVEFSNPLTQAEIDAGKTFKTKTATLRISNYAPVPDPATDFDLIAFASDAAGTKGDELGRDGDLTDTANETVSFPVRTTIAQPSAYVLLQVVYFAVAQTGYDGTATF